MSSSAGELSHSSSMAQPLPEQDLQEAGIDAAHQVVRQAGLSRLGLASHFSEITSLPDKDAQNVTRAVDTFCHQLLVGRLQAQFKHNLHILSEEGVGTQRIPASLEHIEKTVALIDPIDGTDLHARGLSNWCSSIVFFYPPEERILCSIVALESGRIYYANSSGSFRKLPTDEDSPNVEQESLPIFRRRAQNLADASVCFVGQKFSQISRLIGQPGLLETFLDFLQDLRFKAEAEKSADAGTTVHFRLYNLGGNPMVCRLADGGVDLVFDLRGHQAHDLIPAAFIVQQADLCVADLRTGRLLDLGRMMLKPKQRIPYVAATHRKLITDFRRCLREARARVTKGRFRSELGRD